MVILEPANEDHIDEICNLVNVAYRGDSGWTNESDFVGGQRSSTKDIQDYIAHSNSHLLITMMQGQVVSCICIEQKERCAYFGLFAVHPRLQGCGVGKKVLSAAESYAVEKLSAESYGMVVLSQRTDLISYYERRGYHRTGSIEDYPDHLNVGVPLHTGLTIEYLEKRV